MPRFVILSLSASDRSVSRSCVPFLVDALRSSGHSASVTDIRDLPPVWGRKGGISVYPEPYRALFEEVRHAAGVIFCLPIYCYTASGAAKTVTEIIGGQGGVMHDKPAAFVVASGTQRSHLAVRDLMASMAFEQQTLCWPKHVQVTGGDLDEAGAIGAETQRRLAVLAREFAAFAEAIAGLNERLRAERAVDAAAE